MGTVEDAWVALGIDEYDRFRAALNGLHKVKLQVVRLAGTSCSRNQHVAFEIAERQENGGFLATADSVNDRYAARVARLTLGFSKRLTVTFSREHFVGVLRIPRETMPHVLHLALLREARKL